MGNSAKQTQNHQTLNKGKKADGHKQPGNGANPIKKATTEIWLTSLQIAVAIIIPLLAKAAVQIL